MEDDGIRAHFDGRARVELPYGRLTAAQVRRAEEIAYTLGYRPSGIHRLGPLGNRHVFERDDAPDACRRRELTIAALRAGVSLPPGFEAPAPPPPGPPPPIPAPARTGPRQPRRLPAEPPPPPGTVGARPRTPPPPPYPPYPAPPPPPSPPPPVGPTTG